VSFSIVIPDSKLISTRALVFSVKPRWVEAILRMEKRFELRRRPPKLHGPTRALLYSTGPDFSLRAMCTMWPMVTDTLENIWSLAGGQSSISRGEFDHYFSGCVAAHAIGIQDLRELSRPIRLAQLRSDADFVPPQSWAWASPELISLAHGAE
jgi:predicted transcriptional regulator